MYNIRILYILLSLVGHQAVKLAFYTSALTIFFRRFCRANSLTRTKDAQQDVIELGQKRQEELIHALKAVHVSRSKSIFLKDSLTTKDEKVIFCELSEVQKRIYTNILMIPDYILLHTSSAPCDCGVNRAFFSNYKKLEGRRNEQIQYYRMHKDDIVSRKKCCHAAPWAPEGKPNIDPDAVLWRAQHFNDELCEKCPTCTFLPALQKLYKVSSHPSLLQVEKRPDACAEGSKERADIEKKLEFARVALTPAILEMLPGNSYYRRDCIMNDHLSLSGKMRVLDFCLEMFKSNDRVLLFSHSTTTLNLIEQYVKARGHSYLRLDGSTPTKSRQALIDKFQNDSMIFLFLISTKAGGLGLNLTAANKVIIFDVSWNPSYDAQAQDRAFRQVVCIFYALIVSPGH